MLSDKFKFVGLKWRVILEDNLYSVLIFQSRVKNQYFIICSIYKYEQMFYYRLYTSVSVRRCFGGLYERRYYYKAGSQQQS